MGLLKRASLYVDYGEILSMDPDLDCDIDYQLAQPGYNETQNREKISEQMVANDLAQKQDLQSAMERTLAEIKSS